MNIVFIITQTLFLLLQFPIANCLLQQNAAAKLRFQYLSYKKELKVRQIKPEENELLASICGKASFHGLLSYPWAISVALNGINKLGGVIISPYHILTAAHPFVDFQGSSSIPCRTKAYRNISELLGHRILFGGKCIRGFTAHKTNHRKCMEADVLDNEIRTIVVDNDFIIGNCTKGHDWAIIEVEKPFVFTDTVQPICLPSRNESLQNVLMIVGWGRINPFSDGSPLIHETPMQLDVNCRATRSDKMPTNIDDYICMKSLNPHHFNTPRTCYGDSGCGMQQMSDNGRATVVGVTSYGLKGCPPNELARFTRIDCYLSEICEITGVCYTLKDALII